jgi:hypothetical protein
MADYQEKSWNTGSQFTAADATAMSAELQEQELQDLSQDELISLLTQRISALEDKAAVVFPVERYADGFSTLHRIMIGGNGVLISGRIQLEYFWAPDTVTKPNIVKYTGSVPISGTPPTLARLGVYSVAVNGDLTRIARTANDPNMFNTPFEMVTRAFESPCPFVRGNLYASATLVITTGTINNLWGTSTLGGGMLDDSPPYALQVSAQTDLPATIPAASAVAQASVYSFSRFTG